MILVDMRDEPLSLPIPYYPPVQGSSLRATLVDPHTTRPIGRWDFAAPTTPAPARLIISPALLDRGFVLLDHPHAPPLSQFHSVAPPPALGEAIDLVAELMTPEPIQLERWRLRWKTAAQSSEFLSRSKRALDPTIDWFYVELTTHCNLRCPFCPSAHLRRPRRHMDLDLARVVFNRIGAYVRSKDMSVGYVNAQPMVFLHVMGEPILHPHLTECIEAARDAGLAPALFTNATLLTPANIERVLDSGVRHVTLSLNVTGDDGYRLSGGRGEYLDQESRALEFLKVRAARERFDLHVDLQYIASAGRHIAGVDFLSTREQFWDLYRSWLLRLRSISANQGAPGSRAPIVADGLFDPLAQGADPMRAFPLDYGVNLTVKSGCTFGNEQLPEGYRVESTSQGSCPFGSPWRQLVVFVDGRTSFCSMDYEASVDLGNLGEQSIEEIWTGNSLARIRREMSANVLSEPLCQKCLGRLVVAGSAAAPPGYESLQRR